MSERSRALPVGRILRFLLGAWLVFAVRRFYLEAEANRILGAVLVVVGLVVFYSLLHWLVSRFWTKLDRGLGGCLATLPVLLVFVLGGVAGQVGAVSFVAVSLLLAAVRADGGCEVMSVPSFALGRRTHLTCLLFSPLDWIEEKIAGAMRTPAAGS
ncbi:MAG: hypothetical protein OES32_08770 [Acidobacteriota bacterium]|nr:hypothetical protein [Acidobacteriota bacterium]